MPLPIKCPACINKDPPKIVVCPYIRSEGELISNKPGRRQQLNTYRCPECGEFDLLAEGVQHLLVTGSYAVRPSALLVGSVRTAPSADPAPKRRSLTAIAPGPTTSASSLAPFAFNVPIPTLHDMGYSVNPAVTRAVEGPAMFSSAPSLPLPLMANCTQCGQLNVLAPILPEEIPICALCISKVAQVLVCNICKTRLKTPGGALCRTCQLYHMPSPVFVAPMPLPPRPVVAPLAPAPTVSVAAAPLVTCGIKGCGNPIVSIYEKSLCDSCKKSWIHYMSTCGGATDRYPVWINKRSQAVQRFPIAQCKECHHSYRVYKKNVTNCLYCRSTQS